MFFYNPSWWPSRPTQFANLGYAAKVVELLEFFSTSSFYSRTSINESISMQFRHRFDTSAELWLAQLNQALNHFSGTFYQVAFDNDFVSTSVSKFTINEIYKERNDSFPLLIKVFVIDPIKGIIQELPTLRQVFESKIESALAFFGRAFTCTHGSINFGPSSILSSSPTIISPLDEMPSFTYLNERDGILQSSILNLKNK